MFVFMAGDAKKLAVFGLAGSQQGCCVLVAGGTIIVGQGCAIGDYLGHMGLMTAFAVGRGHFA
jgi:hypothetical protein